MSLFEDFVHAAYHLELEGVDQATEDQAEKLAMELKDHIMRIHILGARDPLPEEINELRENFDQAKNLYQQIKEMRNSVTDPVDIEALNKLLIASQKIMMDLETVFHPEQREWQQSINRIVNPLINDLENKEPNAMQTTIKVFFYLDDLLDKETDLTKSNYIKRCIELINVGVNKFHESNIGLTEFNESHLFPKPIHLPLTFKKEKPIVTEKKESNLARALKAYREETIIPAFEFPEEESESKNPETTPLKEESVMNIANMRKVSDKLDGKNVNIVNGVYQSESDKLFIKKPDKAQEFYTELFSGLFIKGLIEQGFIPKSYQDCVIPAQEVLLNDNTYGLAQPFIEFKPLHMLLENNQGDKKFVLKEVLNKGLKDKGYEGLAEEGVELHGLSYALMIKFLIADYSVHDGNIGVRETYVETKDEDLKKLRAFVAFDFGAALRAISRTSDSKNVYTSLDEDDRTFNFYRKYSSLYANMPDVFASIKEHAGALNAQILGREKEFYNIIKAATEKSFDCFKANFGRGEWIDVRNKLIDYIYKDSPTAKHLKNLSDEDIKLKLGLNLNQFIHERVFQMIQDEAPKPLSAKNIKRYQSISIPPDQALNHTARIQKILADSSQSTDNAVIPLDKIDRYQPTISKQRLDKPKPEQNDNIDASKLTTNKNSRV